MSIIPNNSKGTTVITGDGISLDDLPINEIPYRDSDGVIRGSGLRMLNEGTLLAPVGFAVESGSVDFGDVLRLSESAGFLAFENMIDQKKYQLLDYAVPRDAPSSRPYYFYLTEAERRVEAVTASGKTITTNPLSFEYKTKLTARTNALVFNAVQPMGNVRIRISDKVSRVALKYFPSKSSWETGQNGTSFAVGENTIDFQDTALIFQSGTDIVFDIQADNVSLAGDTTPWFAGYTQRGIFIGVANANDLATVNSTLTTLQSNVNSTNASVQDLSSQVQSAKDYNTLTNKPSIPDSTADLVNDSGFITQSAIPTNVSAFTNDVGYLNKVTYDQVDNKPSTFPPSDHTHPISDVVGLQQALDSKRTNDAISYTDLTNKPVIPTNNNQLTNGSGYITLSQATTAAPVQSVNGQTGNVTLSIPSVQIQSDWRQTSTTALDYIKNKPVIPTVSYPVTSVNTKVGDVVLTATDLGAAPLNHTHNISDITGLQTVLDSKASTSSLSGYVTTSSLSMTLQGYVTSSTLTSSLATKYNVPTGTTTQYIRGDGSLAVFPAIPTVNYPVTSVANKTGDVLLVIGDIASLQSTLDTKASTTDLTTGLAAKFNIPQGSTTQYLRGNGTLATFPTAVSSFTNDSGYLTGITNSQVLTALGFTPYNGATNPNGYITSATLPITRRVDNSLVARTKVKYYTATSDSNSIWSVNLGTDFTEVLDVQVQPVSVANTVAGIRQASLNSYTATSTTLGGMTYGNSVLTTLLISAGTNTISLIPSTVVRVRVEGVGT